ncbi:MAG: hypothetical protein PHF63_11995 [Herbinix sp.]|nr:hypothetical protein [Herbinix sp.]
MSCEYKEKVLNYLKNDVSDSEIEAHIEECEHCNAMVEGYLEKEKELLPLIPKAEYTGTNQKLKMQIIKYNRGRGRIIAFTLIGFLMGWLSFHYTRDSFIVTKIIMAIPYKISEAIYLTINHIPYIYKNTYVGVMNEYFPQSFLITFLAERITPVFIGGAIYGSIGYFTGDKRIFTLSKYLKFASLWSGIIILWVGVVFVGNAISIKENAQLKGIYGFVLNAENHGSGFYDGDFRAEEFELLRNALGDVSLLKDVDDYEITDAQTTVEIYMGFGRYCLTTVNWEENYMIMDMGRVVAIPKEFAALVQEFYEGTGHFSEETGSMKSETTIRTGEVNTNEVAD